jgi:hypothetical protein
MASQKMDRFNEFCNKEDGGLVVSCLFWEKQLKEGNRHLKQLVTDLNLDKQMLPRRSEKSIKTIPS